MDKGSGLLKTTNDFGLGFNKKMEISPSQHYMINKDIQKLLCELTKLEGMTTQVSFWGETLNLANNCKDLLTKQGLGSSALKKKVNREHSEHRHESCNF